MMLRTPELLWGLLLIGCAGKKPTFSCCFWDAGSSAGGPRRPSRGAAGAASLRPELRGFAPDPDKLSQGLESVDAPGSDLRAAGCSFPAAAAASSVRVRGRVAPAGRPDQARRTLEAGGGDVAAPAPPVRSPR